MHVASLSDALIDGMSFANRNTASYITARRSCSFPTQSGGTFSPQNLRIMRFNMNDSDGAWLDGSTIRVAFTISNLGTSPLTPSTRSPASLFRRLRVLTGSQEVFDLLSYGRCHELFSMMLPAGRQANDACEGCGSSNEQNSDPSTLSHPFSPMDISPGGSKRVLCQLLCRFFSQGKMLPLSLFSDGSSSSSSWESLTTATLRELGSRTRGSSRNQGSSVTLSR